MMFFRRFLVLAAVSLCALPLHAQIGGGDSDSDADSDQNKKPPTEIPDFSHLDEYIYVPHSNLNFGYRFATGARVTFSGAANITADMANNSLSSTGGSYEGVSDHTSPNIARTYHDGSVDPDLRTGSVDLGNGTTAAAPVNAADGKTNDWGYVSASQITSEDFVQFHQYSDTTAGDPAFNQNGKGNVGMEVFVSYDWKKLNSKWQLKWFGAVSLNDIEASMMSEVSNNLNTITDTYDLYGATPPPPGSSTSGTGTSVLISAAPLTSVTSNTLNDTDLTEHFKLHGSYATFRFGPELEYDFSNHWNATLSAGPTLIYAGTSLEMDAVLVPPTGYQIVDRVTSTTNKLLYGGYLDLSLNYAMTDRTGFYLGSFDQVSTGYNQGASSIGGVFTTRVDFDNQEGMRTGMSYKF